jgi:hypothetical protein
MKMRHTLVVTTFATLVAAAGVTLAGGAGTARADGIALNCEGWETSNYSPGLLLTPREVTFSATSLYGPCVAVGSDISSGESDLRATQTASCTLSSTGLGEERIHWNTGEVSVVQNEVNIVEHPVGQTVVTTLGTVVSGPFTGDNTKRVLTLVTPSALQCLSEPGVTSVSGPVTLTFTPLV